MNSKKKTNKKVAMVRKMVPTDAVIWRPGEKLPVQLQDEVERQVEDFNRREEEMASEQLKSFCGPKIWSVTELLYAVIGFLTTRKKPLVLSSHHDASAVAEILGAICKANDLPEPRPEWPKIVIPEGIDDITNQRLVSAAMDAARSIAPTGEQRLSKMLKAIEGASGEERNIVIANFMETIRQENDARSKFLKSQKRDVDSKIDEFENSMVGFEQLASGQFMTVPSLKSDRNG